MSECNWSRIKHVVERDDGLFDIVHGDVVIGPFRSRLEAEAIARGGEPERKPASKHRRWKIIREVRLEASA